MDDLLVLIITYQATMFVYLSKSLWEFFVHDRHWHAQNVTRLIGIETTYGEPNAVAMSVVLSLPLWLFLFRCRSSLCQGFSYSKNRVRLVQILIFGYPLLAIVSVGLTNSRAGMVGLIAFALGALWWGAERGSLARNLAAAAILVIGLWLVAPGEQRERLRTLWDSDAGPANAQASAAGRWEGFLAGIQMLRERPLTGVGVGNFKDYRAAYIDGIPLVAHNLPGQLLGETGILGGIAFTGMIAATWLNARRTRRSCADCDPRDLHRQLALACQLTLLLALLFGGSLHNGLRYNWIWIAAFANLNWEFRREIELDEEWSVA
jgi:O-antigen ligase